MALLVIQHYALDQDSAELALQLQLNDISEVYNNAKGKGREGEADDQDESFKLFEEELRTMMEFLKDRALCRSIANALQSDQGLIRQELEAEQSATRDRQLAQNLAGEGTSQTATDPSHLGMASAEDDDEFYAKLASMYHSEEAAIPYLQYESASEDEQPESSAAAARRAPKKPSMTRTCVSCRDTVRYSDVAKTPCGHEYCRACLDTLFLAAITDESLYPPRCCRQRIPFVKVRIFLPSKTAKQFQEKAPELDTPNRTYCHMPRCAAWIPPTSIDHDVGICPQCAVRTCTICKAMNHTGDCPADTGTQQLLDIAQTTGWQRCFRCRQVIELETGCNHITCRCRAEFCYVCGQVWKNCPCPQWEEQRLYARAEQIFDRGNRVVENRLVGEEPADEIEDDIGIDDVDEQADHAGIPDLPPTPAALPDHAEMDNVPTLALGNALLPAVQPTSQGLFARLPMTGDRHRARQLDQIMDHLQENHDCQHERWRWIKGPHTCEECSFRLPQYIFECRQCSIQACNRCRRNRL